MADGPHVQITIRVPPEWLETGADLAARLSRPGLPITRTEAFRAALLYGLENMPTGPEPAPKKRKR